MTVTALFQKNERLTVVAQTKLTPSESDELDQVVTWMREQGHDATRSGVIRAFLANGLAGFREESGQQPAQKSTQK